MKKYIFFVLILPILTLPVIKFYTNTPWYNDCMIEYIKQWGDKWFLYSFWFGKNHIDKKDLWDKFKIWVANGCIMKSNNIIVDWWNTLYCIESKILLKI